jgi:hypothetical protein
METDSLLLETGVLLIRIDEPRPLCWMCGARVGETAFVE